MKELLNRENCWLALVAFTLCTFAFSERLNSWGLILICVFTLLDPQLITKIKKAGPVNKLLPLLVFVLVYFVFFLFSNKDGNASHALVSKFGFVLFPLAFYLENYFNKKNEKSIILLFSMALSIGFLYQLISSLLDNYFFSEVPKFWYAINRMTVSDYMMHPGYYSAFLMFGVVWHFLNRSKWSLFFIPIFSLGIVILLSRIVLLFYIIFIAYLGIRFVFQSKNKVQSLLIVLLSGLILSFMLFQIPGIKARALKTINNFNNTSKDSDIASATSARRIAYEAEIKLILKKPLLGYGLGNAKQSLQHDLHKNGYIELAKEMNTHSQYFNTWLNTGIVGLLSLLFMLFFLFNYFRKRKMWTAMWLLLMVYFLLLTDDLLEIQANGVFFILLLSLYLNQREKAKLL
jgi:O-antigen ligase